MSEIKIEFENPYNHKASYNRESNTGYIDKEWYDKLSPIGKEFILKWLEGMSICVKGMTANQRTRFSDCYATGALCGKYTMKDIQTVFINEFLPVIL